MKKATAEKIVFALETYKDEHRFIPDYRPPGDCDVPHAAVAVRHVGVMIRAVAAAACAAHKVGGAVYALTRRDGVMLEFEAFMDDVATLHQAVELGDDAESGWVIYY